VGSPQESTADLLELMQNPGSVGALREYPAGCCRMQPNGGSRQPKEGVPHQPRQRNQSPPTASHRERISAHIFIRIENPSIRRDANL
jgi:hypothetical protein